MATKSKHVAALESQLSSPDERIRHEAALELSRLDRLKQSRRKPADALEPLRKALETASRELEAERAARAAAEAALLLKELEKEPQDAPASPVPAPISAPVAKVAPNPVESAPEAPIAFPKPPTDWEDDFLAARRPTFDTLEMRQRAKAACEAQDAVAEFERQENEERQRLINIIQANRAREANNTRAWNAFDFARLKGEQ
jgi:hypothetical protein